ncbi:acetoacetyl-CoA reductase [Telluria aromaticivorans]|uniref:Acetoacetyl-CoA reductase n=1 Tax=Telluria aromaticivorans TaxID=2725995 RepID=A0A7Y2NZV8_9BURK|nr:acetoacetyl-CoA reductase [Telluria aromaticivorans]NNG23484.1 acetoacetyl-CoA reductase [Telluria aromaticivorans]
MDKIALVTGGTRGLGRAIAIALRDAGCRVVATYHSDDAVARRMQDDTGILALRWDVADLDACRDGVARVEELLGPADILVNNAGITADAMFHKMSPEQWWQVIHTNLGSVFNVTRQVIGGMRARHYGRIVNISSVNGRKGQAGQANYAAAKAGMLGFTKALALENAGHGITVNAVAPGYCDTAMMAAVPPEVLQGILATIPVGRLGTPEDIGRMVAFLASEGSAFVTGATFDVNGGQYLG